MSRDSTKRNREQSAYLLAEEALELLVRSGAATLSVYLIGTLPFLLGFIAYWAAMSSSAHAYRYASPGALGLALLFIWMKALHARFAQHLHGRLHDTALPPWTARAFWTAFCRQGAIHATVVLVYPVCFLTVLPMAYCAGWYQNTTVLEDGGPRSMRSLMQEAAGQAKLWPKQNHMLLWLASPLMVILGTAIYLGTFPVLDGLQVDGIDDSLFFALGFIYGGIVLLAMLPLAPFACFVAVNIGTALLFGIELFHMLTGADTLYTRNAEALLGNTTFIALACGLTYAVLDPILKAAYAIRCHRGQSLRTGVDLRVALGRIRRGATRVTVALIAAACLAHSFTWIPAHAQTGGADRAAALDQALDKELAAHKYTWRMPREPRPDTELPWLLQALSDLGQSIRDGIKRAFTFLGDLWDGFKKWLRGDTDGQSKGNADSHFNPSIRLLVVLLGVALAAVTAVLLLRSYRSRQREPLAPLATPPAKTPDLEDDATTAADLPEDEWFHLAQELAAKGDFRLAARALFFSILATLARQEVIRIARFKSNMDYRREVSRKANALGEDPAVFSRSAFVYEAVWYGNHEATAETLNQMRAYQERLRHAVQ